MASDPSIYAQVGQGVTPVQNMLAMQGQTAQVASNMLAVRALQAKQAAGQAFQQSINPDGTTNQTQLLKNLAADPNAAMAAQDSAQAGQTLSAAEYQQHMARLNYGASGAAALLTNPGGPTLDAVKQYYDRAVQDGHVTAADESAVMQGFGSDPAANAALIKQRLLQNVAAQNALTMALPAPTATSDGKSTVFRDANPMTNPSGFGSTGTGFANLPGPQYVNTGGANVPTAGGEPIAGATSIPNTPSPNERNAMVTTFNPQTRRFEYQPKAAVVPLQNGDGSLASTPTGPSAPPAAAAIPGLPATGRVPAPRLPASAPSATAPVPTGTPAPPASAPTPNVAAPALGVPAEVDAAVSHASAARDAANSYTQRISPLVQAEQALSVADTGKGGETLNNVRAYVQNLTPGFLQSMLPASITDPKQVAAFEEAHKYLAANALGTPGAAGSDARLGAAQGANASVHISNLAARQVVRAAIAQQRMTQAGTLAFNQSGQPAANYDQFMNGWNTQQDPRAYVADKMSPGERSELVKGLGGVGSPAYRRFRASYEQGLGTQVIPR